MAIKSEKGSSCGSCEYEMHSPSTLSSTTSVLNVKLTFGEALKFKTAVDECVLRLNRKNRDTRQGKASNMKLLVRIDKSRLEIVEGRS